MEAAYRTGAHFIMRRESAPLNSVRQNSCDRESIVITDSVSGKTISLIERIADLVQKRR